MHLLCKNLRGDPRLIAATLAESESDILLPIFDVRPDAPLLHSRDVLLFPLVLYLSLWNQSPSTSGNSRVILEQ